MLKITINADSDYHQSKSAFAAPHKEIKIDFIGLRPGEKLYEELLMAEEGLKTTSNKKIFIGTPIDVKPEQLFETLNDLGDAEESGARTAMLDKLHELVPGFTQRD